MKTNIDKSLQLKALSIQRNVNKKALIWFIFSAVFSSSIVMPAIVVHAQYGSLDPSFGFVGYVITDFGQNFNRAMSVAVLNDGKIVTAGSVQNLEGDDFGADFALAEFNEDGSPVTSFGNNGLVITDLNNQSSDVALKVAIQNDGKILVAGRSHAGSTYENYHIAVVRYNPDGTLDTSFGSQGKVLYPYATSDDYSYEISMAIQADGKIVVTGTCCANSYDLILTVRFTSTGQTDLTFGINGSVITSFGEGFDGYSNAIGIQPDGKIVVGGLLHGPLGYPTGVDFALVRYEPDGTLDSTFGTNGIVITPVAEGDGYDWIEDLAILPDGKIIAAGNTDTYAAGNNICKTALVKYNSDGTPDTGFGIDGIVLSDFGSEYPYLNGVAATSSNDIIVSGYWLNQNGAYDLLLAKFTASGSPFPGFGLNGMTITDINPLETGMDVKIQNNGKIVAAGLTGVATHHDFVVLRYLDGNNAGNGELTQDNQIKVYPNPVKDYLTVRFSDYNNTKVKIMDVLGKQLYIKALQSSNHHIDLSSLTAGVYFLILEKNGENLFCQKLVKQ